MTTEEAYEKGFAAFGSHGPQQLNATPWNLNVEVAYAKGYAAAKKEATLAYMKSERCGAVTGETEGSFLKGRTHRYGW